MGTITSSAEQVMHAWAGTVLRIARAKKGVSQRELAAAAAVPPSTIAKIESGHRQPTYPTLAKILASIDFGLTVQLVPLSQCHGVMLMDLQRERRARASDPQLPKDIDFSGTPAALTDAQLLYELSAARKVDAMGVVDSSDPRDVAPILALLIQEAELPDIAGSQYQRRFYAFNAHAEDGKISLRVSDPMNIRRTEVFELTVTHQGWVDDDGTVHPS